MTEKNRIRRTPSQIIADTEAKLAKARNVQAIEAQGSNPIVMNITQKVDEYSKMKAEASKGWSGNLGQRFDVRIRSHQMWIDECKAEEAFATCQLNLANFIRPNYLNLKGQVATMLANGSSNEDAQSTYNAGEDAILEQARPLFDACDNAESFYMEAQETRKAYIAGKKAGNKSENQEASSTN